MSCPHRTPTPESLNKDLLQEIWVGQPTPVGNYGLHLFYLLDIAKPFRAQLEKLYNRRHAKLNLDLPYESDIDMIRGELERDNVWSLHVARWKAEGWLPQRCSTKPGAKALQVLGIYSGETALHHAIAANDLEEVRGAPQVQSSLVSSEERVWLSVTMLLAWGRSFI